MNEPNFMRRLANREIGHLNRIGRQVRRGEIVPFNDFELREYYDRTGKLPHKIRRRSK